MLTCRKKFCCFLACLFISALAAGPASQAAQAAQADIGKVIAFTAGASVLRDGKNEALALHAPIQASDTVQTDAQGRLKILFNDDSSVSLGSNTTLDMREYADSGEAPTFNAHVPQGMIRLITGKITEKNPGGFKVTTPESTVGIRGTIVSLRTGGGRTTVYVENTLRRVIVNEINVPSGNKIVVLPGSVGRPEPILPQERRELGRALALRGGAGVAAAAPEPTEGWPQGPGLLLAAADNLQDTPLADLPLNSQKLGQNLGQNLLLPGPTGPGPGPAGPVTGQVSGSLTPTLYANSASPGSNTFDFTVDLSTGAISNGNINLNTTVSGHTITPYNLGGSLVVNLSGVTGSAYSIGFTMDAYGTGTTITFASTPLSGVQVSVDGTTDLMTAPNGSSIAGIGYVVRDGSIIDIDAGTGTGTITK